MKNPPALHHRRSIRLAGYDYSQDGAYFITICTADREPIFGEIRDEEMILSALGEMAYEKWQQTAEIRPYVVLDAFVIMPNHMHAILFLDHSIENVGVNYDPVGAYGHTPLQDGTIAPFRSPSCTIGAIVRGYKSAVTTAINTERDTRGTKIWQRNYHEHIIRNELSLHQIREYILNNPKSWVSDRFFC